MSGVRNSWLRPDKIAALGVIGGFRHLLGFLQLGVGALVRVDFLDQQVGLPMGFLLRHALALVCQDEQPGGDTGDDGEDDEDDPQCRLEHDLVDLLVERHLEIDELQHQPD